MSLSKGEICRIHPWLSHTVRILGITEEIQDVATYELEFVNPDVGRQFTFEPGQFNMLYAPGIGEAAISISSDPAQRGTLDHTVRVAGNVTRELAQAGVGATLGIRGPFGSAWPIEQCRGGDVIIVTGGIGLAPLRPAIYSLLRRKQEFGRLTLLYGARNAHGLLFTHQFEDWERQGLQVKTTVDRATSGWQGNVGVVTQLLERMSIRNPKKTRVLCCGPEVMMWYVARSALGREIPADQILVSLERNMNCAIGLCGHCQLGDTFVCKDGPVIPYNRVAPLLRVEGL